VDRLQPRHEMKAQKPAERKSDGALTMGIDVLAIDFHFRAMADDALDHRRHLGCEFPASLRRARELVNSDPNQAAKASLAIVSR